MSVDHLGFPLKLDVAEEQKALVTYTGLVVALQIGCVLFISPLTHRGYSKEEHDNERMSLASMYLWVPICPALCFLAARSTYDRVFAGTEARVLGCEADGITFVRSYIAMQLVGVVMEGVLISSVSRPALIPPSL